MQRLLYDKPVDLVEQNTPQILDKWIERMLGDPTTFSFVGENSEYIKSRGLFVLSHLGQWINYDTPKEDVGRKYAEEGQNLFQRKIPLCEAIRALALLKRTLWL